MKATHFFMGMTQSVKHRCVLGALVAGTALASLSACAPLMIGGAVVGGVLVATDRRTSGAQLEDEGIELRATNRIREALVERAHINVTSYNRQVLLTGEVPSEDDKKLAEQAVSRVENVQKIVNELAVLGNSSLTQRSSDALVTGRVKAAFIDAKDLYANAFKVVTERGTVHLMGRVTQREATRATDIARSTTGVQKVVRIFEIISDAELQNQLPQPAKAEATPLTAPAPVPAPVPMSAPAATPASAPVPAPIAVPAPAPMPVPAPAPAAISSPVR
ncbi:MAG: BON domain-containing protein [Burkholderiaceae bacterium]